MFPRIVSFLFALSAFAWSQQLIAIEENGPKDKRINIVVVAEGYTAAQQFLFETDAAAFRDAILSDPTLANYRKYHNFYGIFVASNEEGADDPNAGITRDTYFNATYNWANIDRLLVVQNSSLLNSTVNALLPEKDIVMVSVNYSKYGGSGGSIAVANSASPQIVAHEIGHSFVSLADEYDYTASYTPSEKINATAQTSWANIRWNDWIELSTPLPTPETSQYSSVVGIFEGAVYQASGWYRPQLDCRMKSNGVDLCRVCAEAWVLAIYDLVSPVDDFGPANVGTVSLQSGDKLWIKSMEALVNTMDVKWYIDGSLAAGENGDTLSFLPPTGLHNIRAIVSDTGSWVRTDPSALRRDTVDWSVDILSQTSSSSAAASSSTTSSSSGPASSSSSLSSSLSSSSSQLSSSSDAPSSSSQLSSSAQQSSSEVSSSSSEGTVDKFRSEAQISGLFYKFLPGKGLNVRANTAVEWLLFDLLGKDLDKGILQDGQGVVVLDHIPSARYLRLEWAGKNLVLSLQP